MGKSICFQEEFLNKLFNTTDKNIKIIKDIINLSINKLLIIRKQQANKSKNLFEMKVLDIQVKYGWVGRMLNYLL